MSMFCSCEPRPRMRCIGTRTTRKGVRRLYKCPVCGNTESTSEVVMVDGTGAGKRLIDPRESHYITALIELRRQMAEMQATITRMVEGKV